MQGKVKKYVRTTPNSPHSAVRFGFYAFDGFFYEHRLDGFSYERSRDNATSYQIFNKYYSEDDYWKHPLVIDTAIECAMYGRPLKYEVTLKKS